MTTNRSTEILEKIIEKYEELKSQKNTKRLAKWLPQELIDATDFLPTTAPLRLRMWHVKNHAWTIPTCKFCQQPTKYDYDDQQYRLYCSRKCSAADPEVKIKKSNSVHEKYGNKDYFSSQDYKDKLEQTSLAKYGTKYPAASSTVRKRIEDTNLKKYGVKSTLSVQAVKEKIADTVQDRYGVDNPAKNSKIKQKIIDSVRDTYEKNLPDLLKKRYATNLAKYNRYDPAQLHITENTGHRQVVVDWLSARYTGEILINDRKILENHKLDIVLPELDLAIEINGVYWHGEINGNKSPQYHLNKKLECKQKNIKLVQIWDVEIEKKWDIVTSRLSVYLGIAEKYHARKCVITEIDHKTAMDFHNNSHIQGGISASKHFGLFSTNNELISCMSIGHSRYNKKYDIEILRFSSKPRSVVIGGLGKFLKVLAKHYPNKTCISYADLRWSDGNGYKAVGFAHIGNTGPGYWYVRGSNIWHRSHFQKKTLPAKLEKFDATLSEWDNMAANKYDRVWDCGNSIWVKQL